MNFTVLRRRYTTNNAVPTAVSSRPKPAMSPVVGPVMGSVPPVPPAALREGVGDATVAGADGGVPAGALAEGVGDGALGEGDGDVAWSGLKTTSTQ
jgi:hypothetical protein